jgi:hypothetical protein
VFNRNPIARTNLRSEPARPEAPSPASLAGHSLKKTVSQQRIFRRIKAQPPKGPICSLDALRPSAIILATYSPCLSRLAVTHIKGEFFYGLFSFDRSSDYFRKERR